MVEEHEKLKVMGRESLMLGKEQLDLRYLEQLADREQTQTLGYLLKYAKEQYSGKTTDLTALMESLIRKLEKEGIGSVSAVSYTHLRAHETDSYLVCRLLLEKKKTTHAPSSF